MNISELQVIEAAMNRRIAALPKKLRLWTSGYTNIPQAMILTGQRGCGKSTFLLYHSKERQERILYFSADNPLISAQALYDIVSFVFMQGYDGVIIDEVHFAKDWSQHLKSLYDDFPGKILWASDSSSLVLRQGNADLSRRFVRIAMPLLSFREYLFLETGVEHPVYIFGSDKLPLTPDSALLTAFGSYRAHGTRPFYAEGNFSDRLLALMDKTLYSDIPFFIPQLTEGNLRLMKAITGTLLLSAIPRLQVRTLCSQWAIGAQKLYQLINVMEAVGIVRIVRFENDTKANTAGAKLFFADPCTYRVLGNNEGTEREAFVAMCFDQSKWKVAASRNEEEGDFVITPPFVASKKLLVEVGGGSKKEKSADYVLRDNTDFPSEKSIPFWLLGMMW